MPALALEESLACEEVSRKDFGTALRSIPIETVEARRNCVSAPRPESRNPENRSKRRRVARPIGW
jgi:hypothetical protein